VLNPLLVGLDSMAFSAFIMFESGDLLVDADEVGIAASRLGCPADDAMHVLVWHAIPVGREHCYR